MDRGKALGLTFGVGGERKEMSKMRKCLKCKGDFKPESDEQLFCSNGCREVFRYRVSDMVYDLIGDDSLFSVYDHIHSLLKKEAQGGEEV